MVSNYAVPGKREGIPNYQISPDSFISRSTFGNMKERGRDWKLQGVKKKRTKRREDPRKRKKLDRRYMIDLRYNKKVIETKIVRMIYFIRVQLNVVINVNIKIKIIYLI